MFNQRRLVARAIAHRSREHGNFDLAVVVVVVVARCYKPQASVMDNLYSRHLKCHAAAAVDALIESRGGGAIEDALVSLIGEGQGMKYGKAIFSNRLKSFDDGE